MARDGTGTYSKINTFVAGATVTASGHNQNWDDLATEMTNSVAADGQTPITGPIKFSNGSVSAPALTFNSDQDTGIYRSAANEISFAASATKVFTLSTATATFFTSVVMSATATFADVANFTSTSHIALPNGTTGQRPASQVAGRFRFNSSTGFPEFDNGSAWSSVQVMAGAYMPYGAAFNATISESHTSNAVTFALKTLAGNDPSATDPVFLAFRNATGGTGNYVYRTVTGGLSLTLSNSAGNGSTLGTSDNVAFKVWLVLFDDSGTIRMGAINTVSGSNIYPLGQIPLATSTAEGGSGGADSAQVFYTGTAINSAAAYIPLGYAYYGPSVITTAGNWAAAPTRIQLYGAGVPLPGNIVQVVQSSTTTAGTTNNTSALTTLTNSPSCSITPTSAANLVHVTASSSLGNASGGNTVVQTLRGSTLVGPAVPLVITGTTPCSFDFIDAPGSTSSVTYQFQGKVSAGTLNFPAGTINSIATGAWMTLTELMT